VSVTTTFKYATGKDAVTDTLVTSATVRSAISVAGGNQMKFGTIAVQAATPGTLILGTNGVLTATGGVDIVNAALNQGQAGTFTLKADSGASINVSLPSSVTLSNGANTIAASSFTTNPALPTAGTGSTATYSVGATLTLPSTQASGTYSGTFTVTASYN